MIKGRRFTKRTDAEAHLALVTKRYGLPRTHSQADLDDGTLVELGGGRHVPPEKIVKEPIPELHYDLNDAWVVEAGTSEESDTELAPLLETVDKRLLVTPDEAPVAKGGKGHVREATLK
jgi:hypothetical protein